MLNKTTPKASELQANSENFYNGAAVTPNDATAVSFDSLWIGGAGNVAVQMVGGGLVTFTAVPAGTLLKIAVTLVKATGTTATNIVGLNY